MKGDLDFKELKSPGGYGGNVGWVFTVDYTPCGGKDQDACPDRCAVFGGDLKIKKDKIEWEIDNDGKKDVTAEQDRSRLAPGERADHKGEAGRKDDLRDRWSQLADPTGLPPASPSAGGRH